MKKHNYFTNFAIIEIVIVIAGAIWFCLGILNFNPTVYLNGGEFVLLTQTHFIWEIFTKCGTCVLWNGLMDGGAPTFAEIHNAPAHPFVFLPAIVLGAIDGSKVTLLLSFITAGLAQWRLSKSMGLGSVARVWTAYVVMFGGQLSGKLENGNVGLILATACGALLISELYEIVFKPINNGTKIRLALFLTLFMLSGQGYLQVMVLSLLLPFSVIFAYIKKGKEVFPVFIEAAIIAFLLGAYFYLPMLKMMPDITKDGDPSMTAVQKIGDSVLNLVIRDTEYYRHGELGQTAGIYAYYIYIGWFPILMAFVGIFTGLQNKEKKHEILWLMLSAFLVFLFGSQQFLVKAVEYVDFFARLRFASVVTGMAVFPIVTLAGWGFESLFNLDIGLVKKHSVSEKIQYIFPFSKIILIFLAVLFLLDEMNINKQFMYSYHFNLPDDGCGEYLLTEDTQWVQPLNSQIYPYLFANHQKISRAGHPWNWDEHPAPASFIRAEIHPDGRDPDAIYRVGEVDYILNEEARYATLRNTDTVLACSASTWGGGRIDVSCPKNDESGMTLVLQENYTSGWKAWMDGTRIPLETTATTLTIKNVPKGKHTFVFKYNPWEFWVGFGLTLLGIFYCLYSMFGFSWLKLPWQKSETILEDSEADEIIEE